jgi:P27 family predicted phage terminase small subunit
MRSKPISEHKLNGTYRPDRHGTSAAPGALLQELPPPPLPMSRAAEKMYLDTGESLIQQQMLKDTDVLILAVFAHQMTIYSECMTALSKEGQTIVLPNGIETMHPRLKIANEALKLALQAADRLGINPNARHKIKGAQGFEKAPNPATDPMIELLTRKNRTI